ncbi:prolyl oligopeptidase family serine peptidase [Streptomyces sp. NPDC054796]
MASTHTPYAAGPPIAGGPPHRHVSPAPPASPDYPAATRTQVADELHGRRVPDPYRWLEDDEGADCEQWLARQDELFTSHAPAWHTRGYFRAALEELQGLGGALVPVATPPLFRGRRRFFLHREASAQLPRLLVADGTEDGAWEGAGDDAEYGADARILVDPMTVDPDGPTFLAAWRPSWTGRLLACQLTRRGSDSPELRVLDVDTGRVVDGPLHPERVTPVAWLSDDSGFYYVARAPGAGTGTGAATRCVRLHRIGAEPATDPVVFDTVHPHLSVSLGADGRWLTVSTAPGAQAGNDLYLADLADLTDPADPAAPGLRLIHQGAEDGSGALVKSGPRGLLYAVTDADAPRGRVCAVDPSRPQREEWSTLITPGPDALLTSCTALTTGQDSGEVRLLVGTIRRGAARLALHDLTGRKLSDVPTPGTGPGTISNLSTPPRCADQAWFTYTDFVTPPTVHRYSVRQGRCFPEPPAPATPALPTSAVATPDTPTQAPEVRQITYRSDDGTEVDMYVIMPPGQADEPRPTILTAYGGFGALAAPAYSPAIMAWVRAGGRYAIAGVRGGGEHGTEWHAAGSGLRKPTCFADFAAAARHLVRERFTSPERLAIKGASHAGLTVAAALTSDPGLYAAAVCSDAPTDMVRYPRFGLGPLWAPEFGVPDRPGDLDVLLSYSPYHRVEPGTRYPAVLLTGGRTDPRVGAAHLRKFTAALQHATASSRPVLLRTEADVGHGQRTASRWADLTADTLAFCAAHTGLTPAMTQA